MAQALVKATGDSHADGAANFSRVPGEARAHAEYVSRVWLGVRLGCANCHNHPLDRWTQDDYHGFAAIFAPLDRGRVVRVRQRGEVTHPVTGKPAPPRLPGERFLPRDGALLDEAAQWVTDPDNPFFARSAVNRIWKHMMGRGLIEPVDDLRATNPPTHPELMDALTSDFAAHGYDVARLIRLICNSAAYQRSAEASAENAVDDRFYARALMRPLDAQVLADAVAQATGVWDIYGGHPIGTRATSLFDSRVPSKALDVLGRCAREGPCAPAATAGDIARTLHLINGDLINRKIASSTSTLAQWIERGLAGEPLLEELYLHTLSRFPTDDERTQWLAQTNGGRDRQALEDLFWALLACREFQTNH
jgi:hypothetical protein